MSDKGRDEHAPKGLPPKGESTTAWEDQGSLVERLRNRGKAPAQGDAEADELARAEVESSLGGSPSIERTGGDPAEAAHATEARERRGALTRRLQGSAADEVRREIARGTVGRRTDEAIGLPSTEAAQTIVIDEPISEQLTPAAEKRAARAVGLLFTLGAVATMCFLVAYVVVGLHGGDSGRLSNLLLGSSMGLSFLLVGCAAIVWAKRIMPHEEAVQLREELHPSPVERRAMEIDFVRGTEETGVTRRKVLLGSMGLSTGLLAIPPLFLLRDLGPSPTSSAAGGKSLLAITAWRTDFRFVNYDTGQPIRQEDIGVGSLVTVVPEGHMDAAADSSVMLVRIQPNAIHASAFGPDELVNGLIAYSKICTHAGCPVSLYERDRHHFLCPCHQSTFDAADAGKVLFGPAARALPRLPFYADDEGYLRAKSDFREPIGPSFWERG